MGNGVSQDESSQQQPGEQPFTIPLQKSDSKAQAVEVKPSGTKDKAIEAHKEIKPPGAIPKTVDGHKEVKPPARSISKPAERKSEVKLPYNFEDIIKDADSPIDRSSMDKLYDQLLAGVFLSQKKRKYWIDNKSKRNCFMLYATDLTITWAEDIHYWRWISLMETSNEIPAAELVNVCWLEVHGKFNTRNLNPGTTYEVVFVVSIKDPAYGWGVPVNLRLVLPDGTKQEHKESLVSKLREQWIEIPVGEFRTTPEKSGDMEISMYEYEGGHWKRGLVIKCVLIRPKVGA